jgi:hypothetical protein
MNNESELVKKISLGDAAAFEKLFKSYFQLLVDFCFRFVEDVSIAENYSPGSIFKNMGKQGKIRPGYKNKILSL